MVRVQIFSCFEYRWVVLSQSHIFHEGIIPGLQNGAFQKVTNLRAYSTIHLYSKQQASQIRQEFWTTFGQYMAPHPSAEGEKINWVNYKTGEKQVFFKMDTGNRDAAIGIELSHPDTGIQELYFEQFAELKTILHSTLGEEWTWEPLQTDEQGKTISRIYTTLQEASVFNRENWPALISFFKPRLIALDDFWCNVKYAFEALR